MKEVKPYRVQWREGEDFHMLGMAYRESDYAALKASHDRLKASFEAALYTLHVVRSMEDAKKIIETALSESL